jgi:hypothetical protein
MDLFDDASDLGDMAATDDEIALTWVHHGSEGEPATLWFARLTPELDVTSVGSVPEPAVDDSSFAAGGFFTPVVIAPLPSGWVIAGWTDLGFFLDAFDAQGNQIARTSFGQSPDRTESSFSVPTVLLASRPEGGPLLVWFDDVTVHAAMVSDDGTSIAAPVEIAPVGGSFKLAQAAFAGDTFYVSFDNVEAPQGGIRLARLSSEGELLGIDNALQGVAGAASLVVGAGDLRVAYWTANSDDPFDGSIVTQSLGASSTPSAPLTVRIDPTTTGFNLGPPSEYRYLDESTSYTEMTFGTGTLVVLAGAGSTQPWHVATELVADSGMVTRELSDVGGGSISVGFLKAVQRGPDAIIAWSGWPIGLNIARLQP